MSLAQGYNLKTVTINKQQIAVQFASQVPSYPALAIFDDKQRLVYCGPYSDSRNRNPENGLEEPFIRGQQQYLGFATG